MTRKRHPGPPQRVETVKDLSTGAFGATVAVGLTTEVSAYTARANDDRVWKQYAKLTGSVAIVNGEAVLSTGTTIYAYMSMATVQQSAYLPGKGLRIAFTARFPNGDVDNCLQIVGPYHGEGGYGIGYPGNGTGFGFMHRRGRRFEIQRLEVTAASTGSETVTLTLNGVAQTTFVVTAGTTSANAKRIAEAGAYSDSGGLVDYDVYSLGAYVYFIRQAPGPADGTWSVSSTGTLAGTFTQFQDGNAGTQTWVAQTDWDDPCDGGGPSGIALDPTLGQLFVITYGWLGYLGPLLWVNDPRSQRFVPVHFLPWGGTAAATGPSIADPRLGISYSVASLGSTTDVSVSGASCYIALEDGDDTKLGPIVSLSESTGLTTAVLPALSIMVAPVDLANGLINRRRLTIESLSISNTGTKDALMSVYVGTQANLTGSVFSSADDDEILWVDTAATAITGTVDLVASFDVPAGAAVRGPLHSEGFVVYRGQVLIIVGNTSASTTTIVIGVSAHEDP